MIIRATFLWQLFSQKVILKKNQPKKRLAKFDQVFKIVKCLKYPINYLKKQLVDHTNRYFYSSKSLFRIRQIGQLFSKGMLTGALRWKPRKLLLQILQVNVSKFYYLHKNYLPQIPALPVTNHYLKSIYPVQMVLK